MEYSVALPHRDLPAREPAPANDQASRAAKIIGHLRSFVSQGDAERQPVAIAATIMDAGDLALIAARQGGIIADFQLAEDAIVLADRVQIQQVIFNLIRNAVEAMADAPTRELRISTVQRDDHIVVSISDSGPGIPAEVSVRLFQSAKRSRRRSVTGLSS